MQVLNINLSKGAQNNFLKTFCNTSLQAPSFKKKLIPFTNMPTYDSPKKTEKYKEKPIYFKYIDKQRVIKFPRP